MKLPEVPLNMENNQFIKVWDIAIRVFHWTLVGCFAIAFISSEDSRKLHVFFGYSVLFLVLFRIVYGFVGTKYARFSDFLYPSGSNSGLSERIIDRETQTLHWSQSCRGIYDHNSVIEFVVSHPHRPKSVWGKRTRTFGQT